MTKNGDRAGFTLAELLIVVAIIGVLAAVAVPVFAGTLDKTKAQVCAVNRTILIRELLYGRLSGEDGEALVDGYLAGHSALLLEKGYICPSTHDALTPGYEPVTHIYYVNCKTHGGGLADFNFAGTVNGFLLNQGGLYKEIVALTQKYHRTQLPRVDSNAPDGGYYAGPIRKWLEKATNYTLGVGMSTTWSLSPIETKDGGLGDYSVYWSGADIKTCQPGNRILMMRYDSTAGIYCVGWSLVKKNVNDQEKTYPSICQDDDQAQFKSDVFVEVKGEGGEATFENFTDAYSLYLQALDQNGGEGVMDHP